MKGSNEFGRRLRRLRRDADLNLQDLADAINCTVVYVSDIERGKRNPPSEESIRKLLKRLKHEELLSEMLLLAAQAREMVQISVTDKAPEVTNMLVALARRCDEGAMDAKLAAAIKAMLDKEQRK